MNKTGCLKPYETEIIEKYLGGMSANRIALEYFVAPESIYKMLRRHKISVRTKKESGVFLTNNVSISHELMEKINGWMLGDGTITRRGSTNAYFGHGSKHEEYAQFVKDNFELDNIRCSLYPTTNKKSPNLFYNVHSMRANQFTSLHNKWYIAGKKTVPVDLVLTPTIMKYWIIDDGSLDVAQRSFCLHTCSFTKEECQILVNKLTSLVGVGKINCFIAKSKYPTIAMNRFASNRLLEIVGKCDIDCFAYKFVMKPYIRNPKRKIEKWSKECFV